MYQPTVIQHMARYYNYHFLTPSSCIEQFLGKTYILDMRIVWYWADLMYYFYK